MIEIKNDNNLEHKNIIHTKLRRNNLNKCEWLNKHIPADIKIADSIQSNFLAFDDEKLIGGAIGFVQYNWYFLDLLYVEKEYRNQDVGTKLIRSIEEYSSKEKLTGIRMETWDFQARGFYEKMGYILWAEINDCPPGTIDYYLKKELK